MDNKFDIVSIPAEKFVFNKQLDLKNIEIRQIEELTTETKQQSLEQSRNQKIEQDIDIDR